MLEFHHKGQRWFWNGFQGFFFQPVAWPTRKKERVVREGAQLYDLLREASHYP